MSEQRRRPRRIEEEPKADRATRRIGKVSKAKRKNDNKVMITMICGVVILFCVVFGVQIYNGRKTLDKLRKEHKQLEADYKEQEKISEELKKKEVYVKTNAYIEEQARKIGLVYPDEIIFKPED